MSLISSPPVGTQFALLSKNNTTERSQQRDCCNGWEVNEIANTIGGYEKNYDFDLRENRTY